MTKKNEHLESVQARIEALQETIAERERDIRERAGRFQERLEKEISPVEMVRRHPWQAAFGALAVGFLTGRMLRGGGSPAEHPEQQEFPQAPLAPMAQRSAVLPDIRLELIRSAKELGVSYLQRYIDSRFRKTPEAPVQQN
ncbi:hypothetical protein [Chlorobium sp. N1]|uniref:hypothetical protein n=1 Tax=Chlorobium sp. N1 TaxID=2491138 RepID=UPI00103C30EC|nr:hypothetical protein [Chlorobium sp. N1]TCD48838.1 hypothetical protein E0L29_02850 [Chlorobium sp. N1]